MKKIVLFLSLFFFAIKPVEAASQFTTSYDVTYQIQETGGASVSKKISIKNNTSEYYAADYTLVIPDSGITNLKATRNNREIPTKLEKKDNAVEVTVEFKDQVVGIGKSINFEVTYLSKDVAKLRGNNLEVIVPGIGKEYEGNYLINVRVPASRVGKNVRIQPEPNESSEESDNYIYQFNKNQLVDTSVIMSFGDTQTYDLSIIYYLKNESTTARARAEIALPPSTEYQTVVYESLEPKPRNVELDQDGNYIATYILEPNEEKQVQLKTQAVISAQQRHVFAPLADSAREQYLTAQEYWDTDSAEIQQLAQQYKTPEQIYNFVVEKLSYATDRRDIASLHRQGSLEALKSPDQAVCMEFTDLFIAIARAAGIPAREVNGYGFTEDEEGAETLYADNFHAWPEYYDEKQQRWIQVDPTWEDTTGGFDYFNTFDTNHIAFVRRGISSTYPVGAGAYRRNIDDKTVFVSYRTDEPEINSATKAHYNNEVRLSGFEDTATVSIENTGNTGYIGIIQTAFSPKGVVTDTTHPVHIPPYASIDLEYPFQIPWNQEKDLQMTITDEKNATLINSMLEINPLYSHPYTLLAAFYLTGIFITLFLFNKFVRHK